MKRNAIWAKPLLAIALLGLVVVAGGAATPDHSGLTWEELKAVQATERAEIMKAQSEEWQALLAAQEKETVPTAYSFGEPAQGVLPAIEKLHEQKAAERKEIAKTFAEERAQLARTHAQERVAFFNGSHTETAPHTSGDRTDKGGEAGGKTNVLDTDH